MMTQAMVLQPLDREEMLGIAGGMEQLAPSLLSTLAYDVGWVVGRVIEGAVYLTTNPTSSNYYYCKTGYPG